MSVDWIGRAGTRAKGARPKYFEDPATDRLLSIVMALAGEVAVVKERLDSVERLLDAWERSAAPISKPMRQTARRGTNAG